MIDIKKIARRSLGVIVGAGIGVILVFSLAIMISLSGLNIDTIRNISSNYILAYGIIILGGILGYFLTDRIPNSWQNVFGFGVIYALVIWVLFFVLYRNVPDAGLALGGIIIYMMILFIIGIIVGFSTRYKWSFLLSVVGSVGGVIAFYYLTRYKVDLGVNVYPLLIPIVTTLVGSLIGWYITSPSDKKNIRYKNPFQKCPINFKQKNIIKCEKRSESK